MNPDRLGLALGAGVLIFIVVLIIAFSRCGLPKDPKEWRRQEQQRSSGVSP
ncbi:MAG: hypothetical protein RMM29_00800 [Planctomycetota bacterium]|nr:hypothetical protein [Planctomycetota bacterium]MCX8039868.1 hypothetical protein [Planctomycetota bacterium]MDW8372173.1 hypothetical protein [Planctomycetota bacterium]